ncbi:MAG: type VI secretion system baseplate subunit TssG [Deltaproteobacteria bacterium]|nr:type VI secretion system baseplate subunit TssG [Deltaproteobacteria bacterium]
MMDLKQKLQGQGYRFGFFQAISLLEQVYRERTPVGHSGPFSNEAIRLLPNNSLGFPAADLNRIKVEEDSTPAEKWTIFQNFLGLYGPNSSAPIFIAEAVNQCIDEEDPLREFLDIFNHRVTSLYYRALKKSNLLSTVSTLSDNPVSNILHAMMGHDYTSDIKDWQVNPGKLLKYCSAFASGNRNPSSLEKLVEEYFSLQDVQVVPFARRRIKVPPDNQGRISAIHQETALGESFILGEFVEDIAGQFILRIKMPSMHTFKQFQPGEHKYKELLFLVNMYLQYRLGFTLEFILPTKEVQSIKVSSDLPSGKLGQSAWMGTPRQDETTVTINVTENR